MLGRLLLLFGSLSSWSCNILILLHLPSHTFVRVTIQVNTFRMWSDQLFSTNTLLHVEIINQILFSWHRLVKWWYRLCRYLKVPFINPGVVRIEAVHLMHTLSRGTMILKLLLFLFEFLFLSTQDTQSSLFSFLTSFFGYFCNFDTIDFLFKKSQHFTWFLRLTFLCFLNYFGLTSQRLGLELKHHVLESFLWKLLLWTFQVVLTV